MQHQLANRLRRRYEQQASPFMCTGEQQASASCSPVLRVQRGVDLVK